MSEARCTCERIDDVFSEAMCGYCCSVCGAYVGGSARRSKVVALTQKDGDPDVIDSLERMLARARAGEISGVVIMAHTPSGVANDWGGRWDASEMHWAFRVFIHQAIESGKVPAR